MLIYATGKIYKDLHDDVRIEVLDNKIDHELLRSMDKKAEGFYPVYLANEKYGMRGLDFRASGNKHGICLMVCSPFGNRVNYHQGLMRVGRFGDS